MIRRLLIEQEFGLYHVGGRGSDFSGSTLERALAKAAPDAPADYIHKAAEVLEPLLGLSGRSQGQIHEGVRAS